MKYSDESYDPDELILRIRNSYAGRREVEKRSLIGKVRIGAGYYLGNRSSKTFVNYQNSIVKVSYVSNDYENQWSSHGQYLQREGAQIEGKIGLGFDRDGNEVDLKERVSSWQDNGDPRLFKFIVSPEQGHRMDLKDHVRRLMQKMEQDYGSSLEWGAICHFNTDNPHAHIVLRGVDFKGQEIRISKEYIKQGLRQRSREAATHQIGARLMPDTIKRREKAIGKNYITELDRELWRIKDEKFEVCLIKRTPRNSIDMQRRLHLMGRLDYLVSMGLSQKVGVATWKLSEDMLKALKVFQISGDIIKRHAQHQAFIKCRDQPLVRTFLKKGERLVGRMVGSGFHDDNSKRYFLIEGADGKVHYINPIRKMVKARDQGRINNNDVVLFEVRSFYKNGKKYEYLAFENWGSLNSLRYSKGYTKGDDYFKKFLVKKGKVSDKSKNLESFARNFHTVMHKRFLRFKKSGVTEKVLRKGQRK